MGLERRDAEEEPPGEEGAEGEEEDAEGVSVSEPVGEALGGGFLTLGVADERDDALEGGLGGGTEDGGGDGAFDVEGTGAGLVAAFFWDGDGFAGEAGFVDVRFSGGDGAIDGELGSWRDAQEHAAVELFDGGFGFGSVGEDAECGFWGGVDEGVDGAPGAFEGEVFEGAGEGEEEEEDGPFGPFADGGGTCGDGEHEEVHVDLAVSDFFEDFVCGLPSAGEVGEGEGCEGGGFEAAVVKGCGEGGGSGADEAEGELGFPFPVVVIVFSEGIGIAAEAEPAISAGGGFELGLRLHQAKTGSGSESAGGRVRDWTSCSHAWCPERISIWTLR